MSTVAWAAGFFDGEGSIRIERNNRPRSARPAFPLVIRVTQKVREPLDYFAYLFGGTVRKESTGLYVWKATTQKAEDALYQMLPHLTVKREQAILALQYREKMRLRSGSVRTDDEFAEEQAYFEAMKVLK